jgi:predicted nucleotidyltransferase
MSGNLALMLIAAGVELDEAQLAAICGRYGIAELLLFGSAAQGTGRLDSDVDILYSLQPGRKLGWEIEDLADGLSALFGRPVDLVSTRALHPLLQLQVMAEARPLYAA